MGWMTVSPLTRRRWRNFRANRRGYISLWIFLALFALSLCAELLANEKPLLISYDGGTYVPVLVSYPETTFGGDFPTEADYTDPFVQELIAEKGWILWPPVRFSYDTIIRDLGRPAPAPPSARNWLGTDDQARDVLARVIYGFRISVTFGLLLTLFSSLIGVFAGAVQGFYGGWIDLGFQRFLEIWGGLPALYLLIILAGFFVPSFWLLLGIMLLFSWTGPGRGGARRVPARAQFRLCAGGAGARRLGHDLDVPPSSAQRDGRHLDLFAVHPERRDHHLDQSGFPRSRPAAGIAVAWRIVAPRAQ